MRNMARFDWVLTGAAIASRQWLDAAFVARGFAPPNVRVEIGSAQLVAAFVEKTDMLQLRSAAQPATRPAGHWAGRTSLQAHDYAEDPLLSLPKGRVCVPSAAATDSTVARSHSRGSGWSTDDHRPRRSDACIEEVSTAIAVKSKVMKEAIG